jgi:hypothetical protein
MKYQRVLYTNKFSTELKSKLRIVSYDKRRSLKGNVYYVSFASDVDIEYADRTCKRLRDVTLKPFQSRSSNETEHERRSSRFNQEKTHASSSSSSMCSRSPSFNLTNVPIDNSSYVTTESNSLRRDSESVEERTTRILRSPREINQVVQLSTAVQTSNFVSSKLQNIPTVSICQ